MNALTNLIRASLIAGLAFTTILSAQPISTIAGNGATAFSGDGGPAVSASLNKPKGLALDAAGNIYIADMANARVRLIKTDGTIITVAGNGTTGYSGDNGPATSAMLNVPQAVAIDNSGNLIIADTGNRRIRRVDGSGNITTIAGTGVEGYSGDNGPATSAMLHQAVDLAVDANNNIYFADSTGQRIRKITPGGIISSVAGNGAEGFGGDGGSALTAVFDFPVSIAVDQFNNLYIVDANNFRIREVDASTGNVRTIVGTGQGGFGGDNGAPISAKLNYPDAVRLDANGRLFIADSSNNRVRMVSANTITTVAGTGTDSFSGDGGAATSATLNFPWALAITPAGNILISDSNNGRVRQVTLVSLPAPTLFANGTVNGASYISASASNGAIAPGAIVAIFGTNLASGTANATQIPLQSTLLDTSVTINGIPAPLFFASTGQLNAQVPFEVSSGTANIQVKRTGLSSTVQTAQVAAFSPGIFTTGASGVGAGAILHANFTQVTTDNPAVAGETVLIYATGLGAVNPGVATGSPATGTSVTPIKPVITIGGQPAIVSFSGLAPGYIGLYQINAVVPGGLPAGSQTITISMGGISGNQPTITTR